MKFFTSVVGLIASSALILSSVKGEDTISRPETKNTYNEYSEDCRKEISSNINIEKCLLNINKNNYKEVCETLFSEDCLKFFNDPLSFLPKCKEDPFMQKFAYFTKNAQVAYNEFYCEVPDEGILCPYVSEIVFNKKSFSKNEYNEKILAKTCEYEVCIEKLIKNFELDFQYLSYDKELFHPDTDIEYTLANHNEDLSFLKSSKCTSLTKNFNRVSYTNKANSVNSINNNTSDASSVNSINNTNDASSVKSYSLLLLGLALLYIIF